MAQAHFRLYAELNDFLPRGRRGTEFAHRFDGRVSVKDMIESLGVPHTEVDLILVGGKSVDFSYIVGDGDRIAVYPTFESLDIGPVARLRPKPLRRPRFVLDCHLGRLASYLRALGFDALYRRDYGDEELARVSSEEGRILLTKDRGLLKRRVVVRGYCVRSVKPIEQVREAMERLDLRGSIAPFTRCIRCNGILRPARKEAVLGMIPPRVREAYDEFRRCTECGQVYWPGSHYESMRRLFGDILGGNVTASSRSAATEEM